MRVFSRLTSFFSTRPSVLESREIIEDEGESEAPLGSIAAEIEETHWDTLLEDMDRFSQTFGKSEDRAS